MPVTMPGNIPKSKTSTKTTMLTLHMIAFLWMQRQQRGFSWGFTPSKSFSISAGLIATAISSLDLVGIGASFAAHRTQPAQTATIHREVHNAHHPKSRRGGKERRGKESREMERRGEERR
jgi:hypothetical protein